MRDEAPTLVSTSSSWLARLELRVGAVDGASRLLGNRHQGPLRVQKALYPEGPGVCHAILVHPPGGIKAGDRLEVDARVAAGAHAFFTAPGATKWYRGEDARDGKDGTAQQSVVLHADDGAALEWLPQETIYFNGARAVQRHSVHLTGSARYVGCEVMCFGRQASGETFARGELRLHNDIWRDGSLLWFEQGRIDPATLAGPFGLNGATVCATLVAVGAALPAPLQHQIRQLDPALGASQVKSVFIARLLCSDSEHARRVMTGVWQLLRPHVIERPALLPRIWAT
jgi:urease accessory protein